MLCMPALSIITNAFVCSRKESAQQVNDGCYDSKARTTPCNRRHTRTCLLRGDHQLAESSN